MAESKSPHRRDVAMLAVFAGTVALVSVPLKSSVQSQQDCHPQEVNVTTPAPDGFLTAKSPAVCKDNNGYVLGPDLSLGGYALINTAISLDSNAVVTGSCNVMYWSYANGGFCQQFPPPQTRYLMGTDFLINPPTEPASHAFLFAPYQVTAWDTRPTAGTSSTPDEVGTWLYQFQSTAFNTICTPSLKSGITGKPLQVVACLPSFHVDAKTARIPLDGQTLYVNLPNPNDPNDPLTSAWNNAVSVWQADLSPYGITLPTFVMTPNMCAPTDGHCVQVIAQPPPDNHSACAETNAHGGPGGDFDNSAVISINPSYKSLPWTSAYMNQVFLHEFGHMFDLENIDPACAAGSLMNTPSGACGDGTGQSALPQRSDVAAVVNTTYGTTPHKMCGKPPEA